MRQCLYPNPFFLSQVSPYMYTYSHYYRCGIFIFSVPDKPVITNSLSSGANIILLWTESSPEVNSYEVEWQLQGDSFTSRTSVPGSSTSYTITGLRGESNYTITVTAVNVAGSATSEPVTQMTGEEGTHSIIAKYIPQW